MMAKFAQRTALLLLLWGGTCVELAAVEPPVFGQQRGFYDAPFRLELTAAGESVVVRYTTDGSAPSETVGNIYSVPIEIAGSTVVRAIAYQPGIGFSPVATHTFIFPRDVVAQPRNPPGFPATWADVTADYAMDPRVTGAYAERVGPSLRSLPSLFITSSVSNLFDSRRGIYSNPEYHGTDWERSASIELVNSDGTSRFQVDCGLRIQGGHFRGRRTTHKHSFRVLFKKLYGPGKLRHRLFEEPSAVDEFDTLVLRAGANDGYTWADAKDTEQYLRDEFGRLIQRSMGHASPHGMFVHLYLNGLYWGLYNLCERPNEDFSASYFGGDPEDWDAINAGDVKNGDLQAWNEFVSLAGRIASNADYQRMQGKDPDGLRDPNYPVYLDATNYIDYMIANLWGGNWDWPNKNFWFGRRRDAKSTGFKFYVWDYENTIGNNRIRSPLDMVAPRPEIAASWVAQPHSTLQRSAEYRIDFADRVQRHFFNGGPLTPERLIEGYRRLADQVELAIIAESARWGDGHYQPPQDLGDWQRERDWILNTYLPQRSEIVLQQFRNAGLFPGLDAPLFNRHGGAILSGFEVTLSAASGEIYYTTDGTDPRRRGVGAAGAGSDSPSMPATSGTAKLYSDPLAVDTPMLIKARAFDGVEWSALAEASFHPEVTAQPSPRILEVRVNGDAVELVFASMPGANYSVRTADSLTSSEWTVIRTVVAHPEAEQTRVLFSRQSESRVQFFRVDPL